MSSPGARPSAALEEVKGLLREQRRDIEDLSDELQRKDITPVRILRLLKIVARNTDMMDRIVGILGSKRGGA